MIRPMSSVEIMGPLDLFDRTVEKVQEAGSVHLEEVPLAEGDRSTGAIHRIHLSGEQERQKGVLEELLGMLEEGVSRIPGGVARELGESALLREEYRRWEREPVPELATAARVLSAKVRSQVRRERNLADDLRVLAAYEEAAAALAPLVESAEMPADWEFLGLILERRTHLAAGALRREVERRTGGRYQLLQREMSGGRSAALLGFPRESSRAVREFVAGSGIGEMSFPRYLRHKPFEEALASLESDLAALRARQQELAGQALRFYTENGLQLLALQHVCRDLLARYEALPRFARTEYTFIIRGWAARDQVDPLAARLRGQAGEAVVVRRVKPRHMGPPPVLLRNPGPVGAFEPLLRLLPLPEYGSIDPTGFVATFFPPMFGLMLADAGYGFLVVVGAVLMRLLLRGRPLLRRLAVVFGLCGVYTIVFGLVFGELFGTLGHQLGLQPLWRERFVPGAENATQMLLGYLAIAVGVGVLQVLFGLVLGMINARRFGDRTQMLNSLARIIGILVLFFFVGRLARLLPPIFTSIGVVALLLFLVIMIVLTVRHPAHGMMLPLEVLSTIGNILSYARIMAIGLASVVLALLANRFAGMMGNIVLAVVIAILVHALNLALGIIDPTIQGLRLHYVEFFSKFYMSGGKRFSPFTKLGGALA